MKIINILFVIILLSSFAYSAGEILDEWTGTGNDEYWLGYNSGYKYLRINWTPNATGYIENISIGLIRLAGASGNTINSMIAYANDSILSVSNTSYLDSVLTASVVDYNFQFPDKPSVTEGLEYFIYVNMTPQYSSQTITGLTCNNGAGTEFQIERSPDAVTWSVYSASATCRFKVFNGSSAEIPVPDFNINASVIKLNNNGFINETEYNLEENNIIEMEISGSFEYFTFNLSKSGETIKQIFNETILNIPYNNLTGTGTYKLEIIAEDGYSRFLNVVNYFDFINHVNISFPFNDSIVTDDPFNITWTSSFNPNECKLYSNISGGFSVVDSINFLSDINNNLVGFWRFEEGTGTYTQDTSNYNNDGTLINEVYFTGSKGTNETGNYAVNFSGSYDLINIEKSDSLNSLDNLTVTAWIYTFTNAPASDKVILARQLDSNNKNFKVGMKNPSDMFFATYATCTGGATDLIANESVNINTWYHIAFTLDKGISKKIYINGVLKGESSSVASIPGACIDQNVSIGSNKQNLLTTWDGILDEVTLWNITLNSSNIINIMNDGVLSAVQSAFISFNLTHDVPPNTVEDIAYIVECDLVNSSEFVYHYNNDVTPPVIYNILPEINTSANSPGNINFSTNENANCTINNSNWVNSFDNGTFFIFSDINASDDIYYFNISCTDQIGNSNYTIHYFTIDNLEPTIIFNSPLETNDSIFYYNLSNNVDIVFYDANLFAYEVLIYDPIGTLKYNYTEFNIATSEFNLLEEIIPDSLGNWTIEATATDDHTRNKIKKYKYKTNETTLKFFFDESSNKNKKLKKNKKNVKISYTGNEKVNSWNLKKLKDRYKFGNKFKKKSNKHSYKIECDNLFYLESSYYTAHFICYDSKNWIDFESDDILSYDVKTCGIDCYEVFLNTNNVDVLEFSSIGGLNTNHKSVSFEVEVFTPPFVPLLLRFDISDSASVMLLFILVFLYVSLIVIAYLFKNAGFGSFAFFIGIVIGLMLAGLSIFLTLIFMLFNIVVVWRILKT